MSNVKKLFLQPKVIGYDVGYFYRNCHTHNYYEFTVIIRGKTVHYVNDDMQILFAGNLVFIRPEDIHYYVPYGENSEKFEFFNIPLAVEDLQQEYEQCPKLKMIIEDRKLPLVIELSAADETFLLKKIQMLYVMQREWDECPGSKTVAAENKRNYLYCSLLKDVCSLIINDIRSTDVKPPEWLKEVLENIVAEELITLDYAKLLEKANVSKSYLWKTFKKYLGITPTEYINNMKLEYAYDLIISTEKPLLDVCMSSGFNNYSYFHRLFLKKYKISPNKIREKT